MWSCGLPSLECGDLGCSGGLGGKEGYCKGWTGESLVL